LSIGGAVYNAATGKPIRILGNNVDITEHKEAEEKLRKSEQSLRDLLDWVYASPAQRANGVLRA
jgi:hypothetical protein